MERSQKTINKLLDFSFRVMVLFCLAFMLTLPLDYAFIPDTGEYISLLSEFIVEQIATLIIPEPQNHTNSLISDSTGLYIHTFFLLVLSFVTSLVWLTADREKKYGEKNQYWFAVLLRYYLGMVLLQYGSVKIFQVQFTTPEPNLLFTPLGQMSKDILYWSVMGSSPSYNTFLGALEILTASFLLFRKTYLLGAISAFGIMLNVLAVNLSFSISVKLFSAFLLLISLLLILPQAKRLWSFFILGKAVSKKNFLLSFAQPHFKWIHYSIKGTVIIWLFISALNWGFKSSELDNKPPLYGAYKILTISKNLQSEEIIKYIFIHSKGYFITQNEDDDFKDYKLSYGENLIFVRGFIGNSIIQFRYEFSPQGELILKSEEMEIRLLAIPIEQMRLLQDNFSWTIE